jgi:Spy/CpxP family protein refolding chaperone
MTRKLKTLIAAALIAAAAVPFIPATSQAGSYAAQQNYWHRHDDKGW